MRTVDGDGRTSTVWSDREGRTVCEERSLVENGDTTAVRTLYAYDSRGNLGWTVTPEGYGPLMEAIADYDPEEHDYAFFSVRPDDGFAFKYCYVYERDSRGRVVIKHIPGKGPETFTYDDLDRVVTSQDGNQRADGITVHYEYDGIGRPVGRTVVKAGVSREMESAVYDPCTGLKTSESLAMLMPDGWVERTPSLFRTYEYDSEERVSRVVENDGDNVHTKTITYDLAGNVLTKSEHNAKGNGESVTVTTSCTYDSRNRQTGETVRVDGALRSSVARSYDELGCLSLTTYGTGANAICEYSGYTLNGWLESKSSPLLSQVWLYADGAYPSYTGSISMEWWRHGSSSQPGTVHFHYDSLGRLTGSEMSGQGNRWSERNISYDLCGNVLCLDRYRDDASIPADVLRFTYTGARRDGWGYDPNGNVSFDPLRNFEISHNLLNLPCEVRIGPDPAYNEEGLDEGDVVSAFEFYSDGTLHGVIDGQDGYYDSKYIGSLIYKGEPGEESFEGVQFADGFIPANGGAAQYFLRDHLGSVRVVATDCSTVVRRTDYLPFGVRMSGDGLIAGGGYQARFGFGGKENVMGDVWEPGEGHWSVGERYQHFGARTYDPFTCTFLQIDPMAEKYYGMSPYGYCAGNPVNLVDPDGKDWYYSDDDSIQWTDYKSQEELNNNNISGRYLGPRVVLFNGSYTEQLGKGDNIYGEGAVTASVDVYGQNGAEDIGHYMGFTLTSDFEKFGAIADGEYDVTYHPSERTINGSAKIPKVYAVNNGQDVDCVNGVNPSPKEYNPCSSTQKNGIYVHRTNNDGFAGDRPKSNSCVSSGCLLIGAKDWNAFCNQIGKHGFKLILTRK